MRAQTWVNEINRGRHPFIGDPESRPSSARLERMGKGEGVISIRFDKWADSEETALGMYDVAKYRLGGDTRLGIRLTRHTEGRPLVIDVIMRN